eukprot:CAMPEP_0183603920 /NCGR_PEP_ID=MMETSP0371-20130417/181690_1 /TAXON_ID=268820 /ORGANISM="Peridinium aciculiferum, Strain PAER-2" /LENGTH=450 /DNA_ID=CAMNT_0025816017 /DNA_START=21 /DNA_END=1373 /DNA_ORIENTATION=-
MAVISLTLDAPDMPLNQPMKITITSPSQATHAAADWALLAPFLQQQFGELQGKFAQGFEGCTTPDFDQEACGMSTPSTSASLSPRFDSLCSSPPRSPAGLMPTPGLAPSAPPGIFKVPATPSAPPGIFVAPSIPSAPPGIFLPAFRPPPGLPHPLQQMAGVGVDASDKPEREAYDKKSSTEWCVQGVFKKLRSSCGCAVVLPPLKVAGCDDLRVHFLPGQAWAAGQRSHMDLESKSRESETSTPFNGALRMKLDGCGEGVRIKFCLFVAPSIPSAPPGIFLPAFRPPPGLPHPLQQSAGVGVDTSDKPDRDAYDKKSSIEWCIQGVFKKLKSSCGCPLVSPPWNVAGCDDLRVHFLPGQAWAASQRSHKGSKFLESETSAPVNGLLRLKLDGRGEGVRIKFCLFVGPVRQGPFECDFAERAVHEIPLNMNWSKHLEVDGQNLRLRLQLID